MKKSGNAMLGKGLFFSLILMPSIFFANGQSLKFTIMGPEGGIWAKKKVRFEIYDKVFVSQKTLNVVTDPRGSVCFKDYKKILPKVLIFHQLFKGKRVPLVHISVFSRDKGEELFGFREVRGIGRRGNFPLVFQLRKWPLILKGSIILSRFNLPVDEPVYGGRVWVVSAKDPGRPCIEDEWSSLKFFSFYDPKTGFRLYGKVSKNPSLVLVGAHGVRGGFYKLLPYGSLATFFVVRDIGFYKQKKFEKDSNSWPDNGMIFCSQKKVCGFRVKVVEKGGKRYSLWRAWNFSGNKFGVYVRFSCGIGLSRLRFNFPGFAIGRPCWVERKQKESEEKIGSGQPIFFMGGDDLCWDMSVTHIEGQFYKKEGDDQHLVLVWRSKSIFFLDKKSKKGITIDDELGPWKWVCKKNFKGK